MKDNETPRVVLVDDDPDDNEFHQLVIHDVHKAARVYVFDKSLSALQCWKEKAEAKEEPALPHIVFLDINMPRMTGFELLDEIIQIPDPQGRFQKMGIFILSTGIQHLKAEVLHKYQGIVKGFYSKPLTRDIFIEALLKAGEISHLSSPGFPNR